METMTRWNRLKRWVAPGPRHGAGGRRLRPDAGSRLHGLVTLVDRDGRATMSELGALAWPITAAMLGETALGLCDTKLVGALGAAALGGVGMAGMVLFLGYAMIFGLMRGVKVRTAYAVGEGRPGDAVRYAHAGALLGAAAGVAIWAGGAEATHRWSAAMSSSEAYTSITSSRSTRIARMRAGRLHASSVVVSQT
jgi:hypothetical protein